MWSFPSTPLNKNEGQNISFANSTTLFRSIYIVSLYFVWPILVVTRPGQNVIKNPVTDWLPVGCRKIAMSLHASTLVRPRELVPEKDEPIVVVIGSMAHGSVDPDYTEASYSISQYPLSAALTCSKLCSAFEEAWGIH
ncbi:hypothetical protein HPB48_003136 [Haemaphysalis longicornis]|uniref:Ribosomal RNA small subunit methyltransferase NEP1 n=1 Tax=Haemaphysalis longicornis TaxID=44386 RepID=A0A9J6GSC1_HAELO|nr:hypothetical protein HPB48_003136 [Haemaphysalis longicornis]